jgi:hypothetical protein
MLLKTDFSFLFNARHVGKGTEEDSRKRIPIILNIEKNEKKTSIERQNTSLYNRKRNKSVKGDSPPRFRIQMLRTCI